MHWPSRYAAVWASLYSAALAERNEDAEAESIRTLREMLRAKDPKVQRESARDLLRLIRQREQSACGLGPINSTDGMYSHEHLEAILRALDSDEESPDSTGGGSQTPGEG
jgi:hypothetical protein